MPRRTLAVLFLLVAATVARGGLYTPDEPTEFKVRSDGTAEELPFDQFRVAFADRLNAANPNSPLVEKSNGKEVKTYRGRLFDRIAGLQPKARTLPPTDLATLAADLFRVGKPDEALGLLAPHTRNPSPDFRVLANFAHIMAARGEWTQALLQAEIAGETDLPADLAGTTPEQRKWLAKVERQRYFRWLQVSRQRANEKHPPDTEDVFPLFEVKFVNDAGQYEPGKLAAAEKAKLPPDAIPIVQQLLLWAPWDTGMYWLLGELYAADGRLKDARVIFEQCADTRQYSNRRVFMAHRAAVYDAVAKLPPDKPFEIPITDTTPPPPQPTDNFLPSTEKVVVLGAAFGVVALVLLGLQIRAIARRMRRRPTG